MNADRLEDAAAGALLGTMVGDALGRAFEGAPGVARDPHGLVEQAARAEVLRYTDDTQLTLALAEHVLAAPDVDPAALVATFLERIEPWRGYGAGMLRLVEVWRRYASAGPVPVEDAARSVFPDGSFGNGAAMRAAPVGVRWAHDPDRLSAAADRQARVTHAHPLGVAGAVAQARAVGEALILGRFDADGLGRVAEACTAPELAAPLAAAGDLADAGNPTARLAEVARDLGAEVVAHRSVPAALWAAAAGGDVRGAVALAVGLGGDTDTVGAMAGAVRGAADGAVAIPDGRLERLEPGPHGPAHARELGRRLAAAVRADAA